MLGALSLLLLAAGQTPAATSYHDMFGTFAPDGRRIAFMSDRTGDSEIYVANRDGSDLRRLTSSPGRDAHPAFSPDGRRIAFQSPRDGGDIQIYTMAADGSDQRLLVRTTGFCGVPIWSPDGDRIAFQCSANRTGPGTAEAPWRLFVANADGTGLRRLDSGPGNDQVPSWSAGGHSLLFWSDRTGEDQLFELDLDSNRVTPVTSGPDVHRAASVSADGRTIVAMKGAPGSNADVQLLDRATGAWRRLTSSGPDFGAPQFSPDGAWVLFQAPTAQGIRLHLVPSAGGAPVAIDPR